MNRPRRGRWKSLYLWHRYIGITSAILVLVLAVTGIALQHGGVLKLDERFLANRWLLEWYGVGPDRVTSYRTAGHWVSQAGDFIYIDGYAAAGRHGELRGAADTDFGVAAVAGDKLVLFTEQGRLVETLSAGQGLPEPALGIAGDGPELVLRGRSEYWRPDGQLLHWRPHRGPHPDWNTPAEAPSDIVERVQTHNLDHRIHWERFLLDLHSGRIFGRYGWLLMDIAAVALILLACSGLWVWGQRRRKDKEHSRH